MSKLMFSAAVVALVSVSTVAEATTPPARVVSASLFDINDPATGPMHSTSIAGVPPSVYTVPTPIQVANWNNLPMEFLSVPGSNTDLYDSLGHFTTVDVDWIGTDILVGAWTPPQGPGPGLPGIQSGDSTMMNGAIQSTIKAPTNKVEIHVRDLANSFDLGAGYDVIVYADQDGVGGRQSIFVDDGITVGQAITLLDVVDNGPMPRAFDPALDYDEGTTDGAGTWVRFSGLTGSSFTIESLAVGPSPAFINGFQIVGYHPPGAPNGDLDGDGLATGIDFLEWQRGYSSGVYTVADLASWTANYGAPSPVVAAATAVPEPSGVSLLAVVGALVGGVVRFPR